MPLEQDPRKPLPGEVPPGLKEKFVKVGIAIALVSLGLVLGLCASPEGSDEMKARIAELEAALQNSRARVAELNREITRRDTTSLGTSTDGRLTLADKKRHLRQGKKLAAQLRKAKAQSAADLLEWFVDRWSSLLDHPRPDDRVTRRAALLSQLIGGMGQNLHPGDYVQWQIDFFSGHWLGEVHFDLDGDGLPGKRTTLNPKDGFADVSVCHVAMAINQLTTDAMVLMMPEMRCDSPNVKVSLFLQGKTLDDALDELVEALKERGFVVVQRTGKGIRHILVTPGDLVE